jgi:peptidoglycan/xylan/chitin deacetylase (PgdA/CDA1 family)
VRFRLVLITLVGALAAAAPVAGASSATPRPLTVQSSALTQNAQQLTWTLTLAGPFSPARLARAGRSLCLLLEHPARGNVFGQLCVTGPRPGGRHPRIVYEPITRTGPGAPVVIDATLTRQGSRSLTASFTPTSFGLALKPVRWQVISTLKPPACTPPKPNRVGCLILFPAKAALLEAHTPKLVGCLPNGSPFVNSGRTDKRVIALTFDDGPWYDTPQFLDILERYHVPATFFEIGEQISTFGQGGAIERRMLADGDMVGDHTWSHADVAAGGPFARSQIQMTADAIRQATHGFTPCLFRAPFGATSPALISLVLSMGFTAIQWDIDPRDWARPGTAAIYDNVVTNAHPGAIVLQHDGGGDRSETLAALPQEIQTLRSRGYQFVTITQMFGMKLLYK